MAAERPVHLAFYVFLGAALLVIPLSLPFYVSNPLGFLGNIMAEAHGMLFDLLVIGWFLFWLNRLAEQRVRNNRYREEIDDFLGWASPEATHRIAGNIRRLNRSGVKEGLRLTEACLRQANLGGASLRKADLWGANLEQAVLGGADLSGANLAGAQLQEADLEHADLTGVDLRGAALKEADLERATLKGADLRGAALVGADLQYAVMDGADLERATLAGANLHGASLDGASLRRTTLEGTNLRSASLRGADLQEADLTGADLDQADLTGALLPEGDGLLALFERAKSLVGARFDPSVEQQLSGLRAGAERGRGRSPATMPRGPGTPAQPNVAQPNVAEHRA